jgi:hypothetical protein
MASFFKKALGVFVEFDDDQSKNTSSSINQVPNISAEVSRNPENHVEAAKFEKYFDDLFEKANFPGPDYFEFYKTMETLEAHISNERDRLSATFASLAIQGLTKKILIDTANKYKDIIEQDHSNFDRALEDKMRAEVGKRQDQLQSMEKKIADNSEEIQKLTKEISDTQVLVGKLKTEVMEQQNKLTKNKTGYQVACQAVLNKITSDIQKIQSTL